MNLPEFELKMVQDTEASNAVFEKTVADFTSWLDSEPDLISCEDPVMRSMSAEIHPRVFSEQSDLLAKVASVLTTKLMTVKAAGISAVQMGLPYMIMVVPTKDDLSEFLVACNPEIGSILPDDPVYKEAGYEGCLSFPFFKVSVIRPKEIYANFLDLKGNKRNAKIDGFCARVWQHEYDHLNGFTMEDRVTGVQWSWAKEDAAKRKKVYNRKKKQFEKLDKQDST